MISPLTRLFLYRLLGSLIIAVTVLLGGVIIIIALSGCRQMPVLKGQYTEDKVAQAEVDAKQSEQIASAFDIQYGQNGVLFKAAPDEVKPEVQKLEKQIIKEQTKAEAMVETTRKRADLAEKERELVNAVPDAGAWISGIAGMFSGNFSGILDLLMGALGVGGLAHASRMKSRAQRMAEKAETYAGMDPDTAKRVIEVDEDLAKHRRKGKK